MQEITGSQAGVTPIDVTSRPTKTMTVRKLSDDSVITIDAADFDGSKYVEMTEEEIAEAAAASAAATDEHVPGGSDVPPIDL